MALINCPNCQSIISNKAQKCPHCGKVFKKKRRAEKLLLALLLVLMLAVTGWVIVKQNLPEDYIWMPLDRTIEQKDLFSHLSEEQIDMIEEYIPMVVKWYNNMDVSGNVVPDMNYIGGDINELGNQIFDTVKPTDDFLQDPDYTLSEEWQEWKAVYTEMQPCSNIHIAVLETYFDTEFTLELDLFEDDVDSYRVIDEETWKEIGDAIRTAIDFYY